MRTERTDASLKHYENCFFCKKEFQYGPHRYAGRSVPVWGLLICEMCDSMNWDGLVPEQHPAVMRHLADKGITPARNAKGWVGIPR